MVWLRSSWARAHCHKPLQNKPNEPAGTPGGAATLPLQEIYVDESHGYEVCDIHGKTCF